MSDLIPPNDAGSSYGKFSRGRKTSQNTRAIADMVYRRLRDAIQSAELRPNKRLIEDELADWLNVSRTPIREALLSLEKEGLVERQRGWVVREHNLAEIQARLECRLAVESFATRLAAKRRTDVELQELTGLAEAMEKPGISRLEFNRLNDRFHKVITDAARNPNLAAMHGQTKLNYWDLSVPVVFGPEDDQKVHQQHRALIEALAAGDEDRAEALARDHIQMTIKIVLEALEMQGRAFSD